MFVCSNSGKYWSADEDIWSVAQQLCRQFRKTVQSSLIPAHGQTDILAFDMTEVPEACAQRLQAAAHRLFGTLYKHGDVIKAPRPFTLLGAGRQRPHDRRSTNKANELAPSHARPKPHQPYRNDLSRHSGRGKKQAQCPLWVISGHLHSFHNSDYWPTFAGNRMPS